MCLTDWAGDNPATGFMPLRHKFPGWWSKLEICRPDIPGDVFYMDLDTTVLRPIAHLARAGRTTFLRDFYRPQNLQSSLMYLTAIDRARIWDAWSAGPDYFIAEYSSRRVGLNGDQNFMQDVLGPVARWQDDFPGEVVSYKVDVLKKHGGRIPEAARVVVWHGKPRPWDVAHD